MLSESFHCPPPGVFPVQYNARGPARLTFAAGLMPTCLNVKRFFLSRAGPRSARHAGWYPLPA